MWPDDLLDEVQCTVLLNPDVFCLSPVIRDGVSVPCGILLSRKGWCTVHRRVRPFFQDIYLRLWLEQPQREQARMRSIMVSASQLAGSISQRYKINVDVHWLASLLIEYGIEPKWTG